MKIGIITQTNQKGQVVIPKKIRDKIGISEKVPLNIIIRGSGVYIHPITDVVGSLDSEDAYLAMLKRTKGKWQNEDWEKIRKKRRQIELLASKKRKQKW
jgi:AbrB family looped-hinge helix DNA binding protein